MECVPTLNRDAFTSGSKLPQRQSETKVSHSTNSPKVEVSFVKTKSAGLFALCACGTNETQELFFGTILWRNAIVWQGGQPARKDVRD
jgi:hypothetical protein